MEELKLDYYFKEMDSFENKEVFEGCTYPWEALARINGVIDRKVCGKKENHGKTGEFVSLKGDYYIGEGTVIGANVSIEGPVYIGKNCVIQSGALIRPYSIIGDDCVVGHACETKHCIIQNKAKVQSFTFIGDSIIGKSTRVGSGSILANRRFDQKNIVIKKDGEKIDVGTDFFGAIIGDNSRMGANSTSTPGTFIGPYTWVMPTVQVRGFIPRQKKIFNKQQLVIEENEMIKLK